MKRYMSIGLLVPFFPGVIAYESPAQWLQRQITKNRLLRQQQIFEISSRIVPFLSEKMENTSFLSAYLDAISTIRARASSVAGLQRSDRLILDMMLDLALVFAVRSDNFEAVRRCLEQGARVNVKQVHEVSGRIEEPLHSASRRGNVEIAGLLMDYGASTDVYSMDERKVDLRNPFHEAAAAGHVPMLDFFISRGMNIESKTPFGKTALHFAVDNGHYAAAQFLLTHDANVDACTIQGYTVMHAAVLVQRLDLVELLLLWKPQSLGVPCKVAFSDKKTPLGWALNPLIGDDSIVMALVEAGAPEDPCNENNVDSLN